MHDYTDEEITQAFKDMAETPAGEIILEDLTESFYNIHPFTPESTDTNQCIFREGMRWVVGYILDQVAYKDPEVKQDNRRGNYI